MSLSSILPNELLVPIFTHANTTFDGPSISQANSHFRALMFSITERNALHILNNSKTKETYLYKFIDKFNNQELSTYEDYSSLFCAIIKKAKSLDVECPNRVLDPFEVCALNTQIEDCALEDLWPKLHSVICYGQIQNLDPNMKAPEIRKWFIANKPLVQNVHCLNLSMCNEPLKVLPPEIGMFTSLQMLNISNNQLTSLPSEIGQLVNLNFLLASKNQLTDLPNEIGQLTSLMRLTLSDNPLTPDQLEFLPLEIRQCVTLTKI